jgi:hypothetical protein
MGGVNLLKAIRTVHVMASGGDVPEGWNEPSGRALGPEPASASAAGPDLHPSLS